MKLVNFLLVVVALCAVAGAQAGLGVPEAVAVDPHAFDTVDLMNNNVLMHVPIRSKTGAIPFNFSLDANFGVWTSAGVWTPDLALTGTGARDFTNSVNGLVSTATYATWGTVGNGATCGGVVGTKYSNWYITTGDGAQHQLPSSFTVTVNSQPGCSSFPATTPTIDNSGLSLSVPDSTLNGTVYTPAGASSFFSTFTDANGNQIAYKIGNTVSDSLGTTAVDYSTAGQFKWTDAGSGTQTVTESTGSWVIKTNFGCLSTFHDRSDSSATSLPTGFTFADGTSLGITYEPTPGFTTKRTGRIQMITLPEGGTVTYAYGGSNNGIDCTYQTAQQMTRTLSNGDVTTYTLGHFLSNGTYIALNAVVDPGGNEVDYQFTGFTDAGTFATYAQVLTQVKHYLGNGAGKTLLKTEVYCYNAAQASCSVVTAPYAQVTLPISKTVRYVQPAGRTDWASTETDFDSYGNVTAHIEFDFGSTAQARATFITYGTCTTNCQTLTPSTASIGNNINNRPAVIQSQQGGVTVAFSTYVYSSTGSELNANVWNGSTFLSHATNNAYNANGTPSKLYDVRNNETDFAYASGSYTGCPTGGCATYPFPTTVTDKLTGLATSTTWYALGGGPHVATDMNSNNTTFGYANSVGTADPYWRVVSIADPYSATGYSTYPTGVAPTQASTSFTFNGGNSINSVTETTDAFGRGVNTQTAQSPTGTSFDTLSTAHNWFGNYQEEDVSEPCSTTAGASCTFTHQVTYDALGRVHNSVTSGGAITLYAYSGANVTIQVTPKPAGENIKQTEMAYDGLGRLMEICLVGAGGTQTCPSGATGMVETIAYGSGTGYSTITYVRGSETRVLTYDALGRLTSKQIPETGSSLWSNYYDTAPSACPGAMAAAGKLTCAVDPDGNKLLYFYDTLGRLTKVSANGTACRHYYYDSHAGLTGQTNFLGRMVEATTDACSGPLITDEWFNHDKNGRITTMYELTPHSGTGGGSYYLRSDATYYDNGAVATLTLTFPALYTMAFGLDGEGRLSTVTDSTHSNNIVTAATYYPAANPDGLTVGGSDTDLFWHNTTTGKMTEYEFNVGSQSMTGVLTWNLNETLRQLWVTDGFNSGGSQTCDFNPSYATSTGYDDWGRLVGSDCGSGKQGQTFSYDNYDNMKKSPISGRLGLTYNPTYNTANQASTSTYDAAGNVTGDGNFVYGWNEFNKMKWAATSGTPTCGSSGHCIVYDAFGRIVETSNGSTWKERWITQLGETANMSGTTINFAYWPAPHGGTALTNGNGSSYQFMHKDWQGNTRLVSNLAHVVNGEQAWSPYGESYLSFGTVTSQENQFAGMTENFFQGAVFDTPNRELPSSSDRWLSVDPAGAAWNGYAYPSNPNSFIDPTGLVCSGATAANDTPCNESNYGGGGGGGSFGGYNVLDIITAAYSGSYEAIDSSAPWIVVGDDNGQLVIGGCAGCLITEIPQLTTVYPNLGLLSLLAFTGLNTTPANSGTGSGNKKQKTNLLASTCSIDSSGEPTIIASYQTSGTMSPYMPSVSVAIPIAPAPGGHCVSGPSIGSNPTACYSVPGNGSCSVAYCAPNYLPVQFGSAPQPGSVQPYVGQRVCVQISIPQ
jgi:hypothetical protein